LKKKKNPLQNTNKPKGKIYKVSEIQILGSATQASWRQIAYLQLVHDIPVKTAIKEMTVT